MTVRLSGLPKESAEIAGWLSIPPGASDTLLILVHGGFYTHAYWDFPYRPQTYSCVQWAYENGWATLNIDRLGCGESSKPPGEWVDMPRNAEALHQVVQHVKTAGVGGRRFSRCVLVGHSLGSFTSALMQATYGGADALVLTGVFGVNANRIVATREAHEAFLKMCGVTTEGGSADRSAAPSDAQYLTLPDHRRAKKFFCSPPAEAALIEIDTGLGGTMTRAENRTMALAADAGARVTVPTLIQVGEFDRTYYSPDRTPNCAGMYARAIDMAPANFTFAELVVDTGHNLALHPSARETYRVMADWLAATLPPESKA